MTFYKELEIVRYDTEGTRQIMDIVVEEYPLTLFVGGEELVTLLCSPKDLKYLAMGFLLSEGFIKAVEDIGRLLIDEDKGVADVELLKGSPLAKGLYGSRTITSGCGRGPTFYNVKDSMDTWTLDDDDGFTIDYSDILLLMRQFDDMAEVFKKTGGVHSCALGVKGRLPIYHEDIGRHNAMDKILGHGMEKGLNFGECIVLTSGRISSEMLIKAAKRGVPVIASRSAPTVLAVELAKKLNITLVGFVRGRRFNVYTAHHRVTKFVD